MPDTLLMALAPTDPHVGALDDNLATLRAARAGAARQGATLLVAPHLGLAGGPAGALLQRPDFLAACEAALAALAAETADGGPGVVLGGPWRQGGRLHDAAFLLDAGQVLARRARHVAVPGDGFDAGPAPGPVVFRGLRLGLLLAQDAEGPAVAETLAESGAELLLHLDATPFGTRGADGVLDNAVARVVETGLPWAMLAPAGAQDGLVFPGGGFVLNADRSLALRQPEFDGAMTLAHWRRDAAGWSCAPRPLPPALPPGARRWRAMQAGLAGFMRKNGRAGVLVGLDGSPSSLLSAGCAVAALGPGRVRAVALGPLETAALAWAARAGLRVEGIDTAPLAAAFAALGAVPPTAWQAGLLAALAGEDLLLATADKTSLALGEESAQASGGFSVVGDLWRGEALALAREQGLPASEAAGHADDAILAGLLAGQPMAGFAAADVRRLWRSLDRAEYKRRQAPPGVVLGPHSFGTARRLPLTNGSTYPSP